MPMMNYLRSHQYQLLFLSLIVSFLINIIPMGGTNHNEMCNLVIQTLAGTNIFLQRRKRFWLIPVLVLAGILLNSVGGASTTLVSLSRILYLSFFAVITYVVLKQVVFAARSATAESVFAALSGFLLIGYIGFFLFASIEVSMPGSFKGVSSDVTIMANDLFYYSFISILTVGYGDIVAVSWTARNASIFIDLMGAIYNLVFIARIVSDFSTKHRGV